MKNKVVTKLLAYLLVSAIVTTTVTGGVGIAPVTVYAADVSVWDAGSKDTNEVEFGDAENWDWNNTLRAEFDGNNQKISADATLTFTMTMDATAFATMKETDHIKLQAVFFNEKGNWDADKILKLGYPEYKPSAFTQNANGTYSTEVTLPFSAPVDTFASVLIQGVGTGFKGKVSISDLKITVPDSSVWNADSQDTNEVEFGDAENWDWNNTLRAEFDGNNQKISADATLTFTMTMDATAFATMKETDHIKLQAVFFNEKGNWDADKILKLGYPEYKPSAFTQNANGTYSTEVTLPFSAPVDTFASVLIQGVGTGFKGKVTISDIKITLPENEAPDLKPTAPTVVAKFDENIAGWAGEAGWDYSAGKENPKKNDTGNPIEAANVAWDETTKSLKMSLDYSKDTSSGWSEAKVTGSFTPVDVTNYNIVTFKLRYPSSMETVRTKLFMKSTDETKILDAEGSFRTKTVEKGNDGWSTVTIRGEFTPQAKEVSSLTIGIVGPYADLKEVYIDDVTFGQLDASEDYVKITTKLQEAGDQVALSNMPKEVKLVDSNAKDSTKALAAYLSDLQKEDKVLVGHQNSTFRSVRTNGKISDVKDVTTSEAGLFGIDTLALAGSEANSENPMEASIEASKTAYNGGSIITLSCHMPNFTNKKIKATDNPDHPYDFSACDFAESKDLTPCADYILEGGEYNAQFNAYLDIIAEYALELQEENIPILFRPFHENSGGWFWWGTSTSPDSYKAMWKYMVNYLQDKGVHNMLYVYSPNGPFSNKDDYLARYPGDEYVDVLGFDYYDDYADPSKYTGDTYFAALADSCKVVADLAEKKNKIPAIAETGIRITGAGKDSLMVTGNPTKDHDWYNKVINTAVENDIPYFLLWANFSSANFFIPYKFNDELGQEMINDFISAYNNDNSIFGNGTNFYGENGAVSKAGNITLTGYSESVGGYLLSPKNYSVIKEACELKASVKNATKVEFVIKTSEEDTNPVIIGAKRESEDSTIYTAQLTSDILATIEPTGTGIISVVAYGADGTTGTNLGSAQFINFNQDAPVMPSNVFDNFEYYYGNDGLLQTKYGSHNSAAGCSSSVTLDSENKVEGSYGCDFNYTLAYKGSEVWTGGLGRTFDTKDFSKYNALSMWVKPDGNGQKMVIQLKDSKGKEYEAYLTDFVKKTEAQYVTIPFTSFIVKGGTTSIDPSNIVSCYYWCNSVPENYDKKDESGNYTVSSKIVFDDVKAIKVSDADLAKMESGQTYITSNEQLKDISGETGSDSGNSGSTDSGNTVVTNPDGSTSTTTTTTKPDGSTVETVTTTKPDGTSTIVVSEQEKNETGKTVEVTTTTEKDAEGNVTGTTEKSVIADAAKNTSATVTVTTDSNNNVTATAEVTKEGIKVPSGTRGTIAASVIAQITEAAGTTDVTITQTVTDSKGKELYTVTMNASDAKAGTSLTIVKLDEKTGEYVLVNKKEYPVTKAGNVVMTIKNSGDYMLISKADATALTKKILKTVKPAASSKTVKKGKSTTFTFSKSLNMKNVAKITYVSSNSSVAKVSKTGKITAKKVGTVTIKVKVTLKDGSTKTVSMKIKVK